MIAINFNSEMHWTNFTQSHHIRIHCFTIISIVVSRYRKSWQKWRVKGRRKNQTTIILSYKLNPATNWRNRNEVVLFRFDQSIGKCECGCLYLFVCFHARIQNRHYFFFNSRNDCQAKSFFLTPFRRLSIQFVFQVFLHS